MGDRRRRWKGGYVAESDIVVIEDRTYCFLYAAILRPSTSPPPSRLRRQKNQSALSRIGFDRSVPRTLRPPWQGGPRGLSNFATKCNLLPLLQEEAKEAVRYFNQQQLSPQNPVFINLTSMRRRLKGPAPHQYGCSALRKQTIPPKRAPIKRGSRGNPLGVFRPLLRPKGDPQPGGCPSGEDTRRALP